MPRDFPVRAPRALPDDHPTLAPRRVGVLLINLGTPEATDYWSVRRYLSQFLSDRRVVELSPLLWQPILQGIVLSRRPTKSGEAYASIWDKERNESPLRAITRRQAEGVAARFAETHPDLVVDWAMRYGQPSIPAKLQALQERGCERILLLPLYPQYSAATTATACDEAFRWAMRQRWQPSLRVGAPYYDDPRYIEALGRSMQASLETLAWEPERLLVSFHGMPRETLAKGDPYHCHCQKTGRLLREWLDWPEERFQVVFQSRFGPKEWLQPYADATVAALAGEGVKRLAIVSPGFAADCLETLEELAIGLKESFLEGGGSDFAYLPCLNDSPGGLDLLQGLVEQELAGWL
ncbi:ferrochelatase [Aquibaculum sediminis]|uniref:ferrochelatase n=1 Tax=Aquibaculum sediminis TaxID=3231907 RepID=UPI003455CAB0